MTDLAMGKCERCGMTWFERKMCPDCAFTGGGCTTCGGTGDGGPAEPHECPEPLPYEMAKMAVDVAAASRGGLIVSQRQKAAIKLGLEAGPDAS